MGHAELSRCGAPEPFRLAGEKAAEGGDELGSGERLLEVCDVIGRKVLHFADLFAAAGDDDDGKARGELAESMSQLDAAELWA